MADEALGPRLDHVGIAVDSIRDARQVYEAMGLRLEGIEEVIEQGNVSPQDLELIEVCDDVDQVVEIIRESYNARGANGSDKEEV